MTRNAASALKSALGQKQTFAVQKGMSALPLKADIGTITIDQAATPQCAAKSP